MRRKVTHILLAWVAALMMVSCSTTSKLAPGETLYTGVKKLSYTTDTVKLEDEIKDKIFTSINVKPNNPLYSPYYRTPFPVGLWVYNNWDRNSKGLKGWLYKKLVSYPVLMSKVRPETRVEMINTLLQDNGYFTSEASYQIHYSDSTHKKGKVSYDVKVREPYRLDTVKYLCDTTTVGLMIDSLARQETYFRTGNRYSLDSLNNVRINIANNLRNLGYYFYRPEYIEYKADSVTNKGHISIQMVEAPNVPAEAHRRYLTNNVIATVEPNAGGGVPDTLVTRNCTLIKMSPVRINNKLIPQNIRSRRGKPFRVGNMDRTQMYLSRTGIFSNIDMQVVPLDSITPDGDGMLDLHVNCTLDSPYEVKFEVQGTSKSNSYIGPALNLGMSHKNLWGGGEQLSGNLAASYEFQTGSGGSKLNSYEFGLDVNLAIPRLLAPRFVDRSRRYLNWTRVGINASILNRPKFFKMLQLGGKFSWEWHANRHSLNEFVPFKLTYNKLLSRTDEFIDAMNANPGIAQSFNDVFIPQMQYNYTYENTFGANTIVWTSSVTEAGNIFAGLWRMCGAKGTMKMIGTPFSQFVKAQAQLVWEHKMGVSSSLVGRVFVGAAHAYGNSDEVPFSEQFYVGGANSIRAFAVRSIGPGSYKSAVDSKYAFYDQTGTFKFETNWEYRFHLFSYFHGALFVDAGNVWLLKEDEYRPGSKLTAKSFFKDMAVGTGLGLRFDMQMIVVRADLGVGLHAPYDTGKSGFYNMTKFKDSLALHIAIGYPF